MNGQVFDLQRFSMGNGPGIRTTVFFQGCPLRCRWCHNPESFTQQPVLQYIQALCTGCASCVSACPQAAHELGPTGHRLLRDRCRTCGRCAELCPSGALRRLGRRMTVVELEAELMRDAVYFRHSGGGVTFSGGEPTLQADFALATAERLRLSGIHLALDTCGLCRPELFREFASRFDLFLFDIKHMDTRRHRELTGMGNEWILQNLEYLVRRGSAVQPRFPMIPGCNDDEQSLRSLAAALGELGLHRLEVSVYHDYGREKYGQLGIACPPIVPYGEGEEAARLSLLERCGLEVTVI